MASTVTAPGDPSSALLVVAIRSAGSPQRHEGTKICFVPSCLCGEPFAFAAMEEVSQLPPLGISPRTRSIGKMD